MDILPNELENYISAHTTAEPALLADLRRETFQKTTQPHMISGEYQGRLLSLISKIIRPKNILEVGTFTGYATLCLAEGLAEDGQITTIDRNEELMYLPKKYFELSEYNSQINCLIGDAGELIEGLNEKFDLVFIDADKENYINYYEQILPKMNSGGVILADNVLWYGKVMNEVPEKDKSTRVLQEFNRRVSEDNRVEVVLLPVRDGISLIRKK